MTSAPALVRDGYAIHRCTGCGLHRVWPPVTPEALAAVYTAAYFQRGDKYSAAAQRAAARNDGNRVAALRGIPAGGRVLDVGCATGSFLLAAAAAGYAVDGVEPAEAAARTAAERLGRPVHAGPLETLPDDRGGFDALTLWDVIEHVPDPAAVLAGAAGRLRPGGRLVLSTGDIGSAWARLTGVRWPLLTPPQHLFFFTPDAMRRMLTAAGFSSCTIAHPGKWVTLGFAAFKAAESWGRAARPLVALLKASRMDRLCVRINLGDIMTLCAHRAGGS
jgi:SAM-dependent methyltransferase